VSPCAQGCLATIAASFGFEAGEPVRAGMFGKPSSMSRRPSTVSPCAQGCLVMVGAHSWWRSWRARARRDVWNGSASGGLLMTASPCAQLQLAALPLNKSTNHSGGSAPVKHIGEACGEDAPVGALVETGKLPGDG
jgi:hypothetical protein